MFYGGKFAFAFPTRVIRAHVPDRVDRFFLCLFYPSTKNTYDRYAIPREFHLICPTLSHTTRRRDTIYIRVCVCVYLGSYIYMCI